MKSELNFKSYGTSAILIEWEAIIDEQIIKEINSFKHQIFEKEKDKIQDYIIGYNSLLIRYSLPIAHFSEKVDFFKEVYQFVQEDSQTINYLWEIPVCYDQEFGFDLETLAQEKQLSTSAITQQHTSALYSVYFIGFLPGFLYLGGLDQSLHTDRKSKPLLRVPKGSVAIGGQQTGIYPQESAGGWHIIGKTPIPIFDVQKEQPCFAKSGDQIQFVAIDKEEFHEIEIAILEGTYQLTQTVCND